MFSSFPISPCKTDVYFQGCEHEVADAEKGASEAIKSECIMRLSWALVHSKRPEDVQRGIAMLEGKSQRGDSTSSPPPGQFPSFFPFLVPEASFLIF